MEHTIHYVEVVTPNVAAVCEVYTQAHGWKFQPVPALGGAMVAELPNGSRWGVRAPMRDSEKPVTRNYVRVDDLAKAVEAARQQGAEIAVDAMAIPGEGTIAIYLIGGIEQGLWQLP